MRRSVSVALMALAVTAPAGGQQAPARSHVFAAPYQADSTHTSVLIGVEIEGWPRDRPLELTYHVSGDEETQRRTVTVAGTGGTTIVLTRHLLRPGNYRLRIDGHVSDLQVPDLAPGGQRLSMSGVTLTSSRTGAAAHADEEADRALPVLGQPPTARREFSADEKLEVHVELYELPPPDVDVYAQLKIVTRLLGADGSVLFEAEDHGCERQSFEPRSPEARRSLVRGMRGGPWARLADPEGPRRIRHPGEFWL
jgi:hypothetical protein